jgi:hypothetical protein
MLSVLREIPGKGLVDHTRRQAQVSKLIVRDQSARIRRKIQEQIAVAANRRVADVNQIRGGPHLLSGAPTSVSNPSMAHQATWRDEAELVSWMSR